MNTDTQQTSAPTTATVAEPSPPSGVGYTVFAGSLAESLNSHVTTAFRMTAGSGASGHFVDSHLLPNTESEMLDGVKLDPPMCILLAAGRHSLKGSGKTLFNN